MRASAASLPPLRRPAELSAQQKIEWPTVRRTLALAAPHTGTLILFFVIVVVTSSIGITYPLLYRVIINEGIVKQNTALIVQLAALTGGLAVIDAALGLGQTYLAARVGAQVVQSLRTKLFDHIQQMPMAFSRGHRPVRWSVD